MSALTNYSKWDSIDDSSDDEGVDVAPRDDPTLVAARNVVRELKHRLALLDRAADSVSDRVSDSALDEGWTSPPLPGGASRQQLFTATCLRHEFPGVFSNEPEAACVAWSRSLGCDPPICCPSLASALLTQMITPVRSSTCLSFAR